MFGLGKGEKVRKAVDAALKSAQAGLSLNTEDGRSQAYHALIDVLGQTEEADVSEYNARLFMMLGDVYWQADDYETALQAYTDAVASPGGIGDEHIHLRLGKAQFELGNEARAADELCRAYMGGGKEIFDSEPAKYFVFLKTKIQPGPDGW